ncbi:hypothetical protein I7I48_00988 [Histoplasma ohiense]|nr:hypothetical protein I7I48_00988 [Histoplasma ohiense (nom. inval.)]
MGGVLVVLATIDARSLAREIFSLAVSLPSFLPLSFGSGFVASFCCFSLRFVAPLWTNELAAEPCSFVIDCSARCCCYGCSRFPSFPPSRIHSLKYERSGGKMGWREAGRSVTRGVMNLTQISNMEIWYVEVETTNIRIY